MTSYRKKIALTFDDGPSAGSTARILSALEKAGAKATFFVIGNLAADHADLLKRMVRDGFEIGNHTWNHDYIKNLDKEGIRMTLQQTGDAIKEACGVVPQLMRPPGLMDSSESRSILGELGYPAIIWSVDPRDWKTRDAQSTIDFILDNVQEGDIILMHDIYEPSAAAAEFLIPELIRQGYELVTVSELAADYGELEPGRRYFSFRPSK